MILDTPGGILGSASGFVLSSPGRGGGIQPGVTEENPRYWDETNTLGPSPWKGRRSVVAGWVTYTGETPSLRLLLFIGGYGFSFRRPLQGLGDIVIDSKGILPVTVYNRLQCWDMTLEEINRQ